MTRVTWGICLHKNSDPRRLSAPAPGLYTCIKTWKIMYKIGLQRYFFETCNKWAKWQCFSVDIRSLSTKSCLPVPRGYIHMEKHEKMFKKSEFKEICLKLATNGRSDKSFLLTSKVCPQRVFCPCPRAIHMYKIIKNVYKIRFWRDYLKLALYGQREKAFLLSSKFCPQGVVCPCPGAIYMYKNIKIYTRTRCQVRVYRTTGPVVLNERMSSSACGWSKYLFFQYLFDWPSLM